MQRAEPTTLSELERGLLEALPGAAAVIDADDRVFVANHTWLEEGLAPIGERLDEGPFSALSPDVPSLEFEFGGISCRVHVSSVSAEHRLVQIEIESDALERMRYGEIMEEVLRQFPVIYFRIDADGVITDALGAGLAAFGRSESEIVGTSVFETFPNAADSFRRGLAGESHSYIATGDHLGRRWAFRSYISPDRRRGGVLSIALDVTEQVDAKEALLESEHRLREVADQVPGVVYCYDTFLDGTRRTLFMGSGLESLLDEEIAGQVTESPTPLFDRIAPEGLAMIRQVGPAAIDRGEPIDLEYEMSRNDGSSVWVRNVVRSVRLADGSVRNTGVLMDVTAKHRAEAALRDSRELLNRTQQLATIGGWQHNVLTNKVAWTDQVYDILGLPRDKEPSLALVLQRCDERSAGILREAVDRCIRHGEHCDVELTILREADNHRFVRVTGVVQVEHAKPIMILGTIQDITQQRKLEFELRHAQKMEAVGQLASGIAHEFNNLISTVSGHVDHARRSIPPDGPAAESLGHLAEAMERAFGLARGLLAFSRKTAPRRESVDVAMIVDQAEKLLRRTISKRIELDARAEEGLWTDADPSQLLQVILNLAINARDAMPDGGFLSIEARSTPGYVQITVADTGQGIPEPIMRRIFEPFFTTKPSDVGTGLGLALSRGIVEDHKGHISVRSEPGKGAVFTVLLPWVKPEVEEHTAYGPGREAVLFEAQPFVRSLLTTILMERGFSVRVAQSCDEALAAGDASLTMISSYEPLDGLLGRLHAASRVIIITGEEPPREPLPPGVAILPRPFRSSDVLALISTEAALQ